MTLDLARTGPKPPPEKPEAEASLIGSILIDAHVYEETVRGRIAPAELSREQHRLVLGAIERVWERGEPLGFQTVQAELAARSELETIGGAQFLVGLMQNVPTVAHAETYATIVERTALLRRLIGAANEIAHLALTREDARSAVEDAQELLFAVSESNLHRDVVPLELALRRFADQITARADDQRIGVPTGFASLDAKTGGLQPSDLILIAGRPGLGKTSLALNFIWNAAAVARKTCAIFSLEMSEMQVVQRLISMTSEIDGNRMRRGRLSGDEFRSISLASDELQKAPIYVEESSQLSVTDILAKSRRLQAERGLDLLVIDYLQLIEGAPGDEDNRVLEVARISRSLKAIARELQVPVIAVSQLSRQIETRGTEPMLSDLRECVTGDTEVVDADSGCLVQVRALAAGARIVAVDGKQRTGVFEVADVWSTGRKPVYRMTSQSGRVIRATGNHPFLTPQGWRRLEDLSDEDLVATAMRLPEHGSERPERAELCRLLGYLVGDGTYRKWGAVGFIASDPEHFNDVLDLISRHFAGVTPRNKADGERYQEAEFVRLYENGYGKPFGNPLREWLRTLGVHGQTDEVKRVPAFVFESGRIGAAQFLAGYLASDGCVKSREARGKRRRWAIQFDTVSPLLAHDVQALLLRIGVHATIRPGAFNTKSTVPIYRIDLQQTGRNLERFATQVPARGRKADRLRLMLEDRPVHETSPGMYALPMELSRHLRDLDVGWKDQHKRMRRSTARSWAARTGDELLSIYAESDLLWERIRSIYADGLEEVFDLRVPASGNFVANGFVVHNSGALEADADLVMFLWQKDRKDRDENVVRLKLAKHRNGPTGDFDLHFQSELTRFRDLGETRQDV